MLVSASGTNISLSSYLANTQTQTAVLDVLEIAYGSLWELIQTPVQRTYNSFDDIDGNKIDLC